MNAIFSVAPLMKNFTFSPLGGSSHELPSTVFFFFTVSPITADVRSFGRGFRGQVEVGGRCKWYKIQDFHCQNLSILFVLLAKSEVCIFSPSNTDLVFLYINWFL